MTFIPESQKVRNLRAQDLADEHDLFKVHPDFVWYPRVTVPLRAGDCTFHSSFTAHMATPNFTDEPRVAHIIIYMDADTTFMKQGHPVTDSLNLEEGQLLDNELFPIIVK
jgi:phytanoyl-CoA hydroxylase